MVGRALRVPALRAAPSAYSPVLGVQLNRPEPLHVLGTEEHVAQHRVPLLHAHRESREDDALYDEAVGVGARDSAWQNVREGVQ